MGRALALAPQEDSLVRARKVLQTALQRDPACTEAALALAEILTQAGDHAGAVDVLTAVQTHRNSPQLHVALGVALTAVQRYDAAQLQFNAALCLQPGNESARAGLDTLLKLMSGAGSQEEGSDNELLDAEGELSENVDDEDESDAERGVLESESGAD